MAHNFNLNEPIVRALVAQLVAQLPAAVATVNADVTDSYPITDPVAVYDHMPLLTTLAGAGFPAVAIEDGVTRFEDDLVSSVDANHRLLVVPFLSNPDPEGLAWQLRRYQQAVLLAIQYDRQLGTGGTIWTTRLLGVEPGPMLGPAEKPGPGADSAYVSWVALEIECPRSEV